MQFSVILSNKRKEVNQSCCFVLFSNSSLQIHQLPQFQFLGMNLLFFSTEKILPSYTDRNLGLWLYINKQTCVTGSTEFESILSVSGMVNWIIGIQNQKRSLRHQLIDRAPGCPNPSLPSSHRTDPLLFFIKNYQLYCECIWFTTNQHHVKRLF